MLQTLRGKQSIKYQMLALKKIKLSRLLVQRINEFIHYRFNVKHHGKV